MNSARSSLSPMASFYKTSNPHGPGSQAYVHLTMPYPDHHPSPRATLERKQLREERVGIWRVWRVWGGLGARDYIDRKGLRLWPERGHDDG